MVSTTGRYDRRLGEYFRKCLIVGHAPGRFGEPARLRRRQAFDHLLDGILIRLGEQDVESNRRGAALIQPLDQIAHPAARPWPLTEPFQQFLIDVDDTDGNVGIVTFRRQPLIGIERHQPQRLHEERIGRTATGRDQQIETH